MSSTLAGDISGGTIYRGYAYSYPHKTTHRPLDPHVALDELWATENRDALSLYIHVPFCRSRCGYCNLFALPDPDDETTGRYIQVLARQARRVRESLAQASFARLAIGGGTPSCLDTRQLTELFRIAADVMGVNLHQTPTSIEASPTTVTPELMRLLAERGVDRLSIGVQSFSPQECKALGRPQARQDVRRALQLARRAGPPTLNLDLIYGIPGQTRASWLASVEQALAYEPDELYLYPLYIRPVTAMCEQETHCDSERLEAYRLGRNVLAGAGYEQVSMRMFRKPSGACSQGPAYSCQSDGMIGLGCGPRSYTRTLHYSGPYAVSRLGMGMILAEYLARDDDSFARADFGIRLDGQDQRRRYVIQSILQCGGLDRADYRDRFDSDVLADLPELTCLATEGLAQVGVERIRLTEAGIERSDAIGPGLYSPKVQRLMEEYRWR